MRIGVLLCLLIAGCDAAPGETEAERRLRVDVVGDVVARDDWRRRATQAGLVSRDAAGAPVPGLAGSWRQTSDGRSLILRLRPNLRWSDGRPLAASEVVESFRRLLGRRGDSPLKPYLQAIENAPDLAQRRVRPTALGVTAPLPEVVEFRLATPAPELLRLLALPDSAVTARARADRPTPVLGPFTLAAAPGPARVTLRRNPLWHDAEAVRLDAITLTAVDEPALAVARFGRGEADVTIGAGIAGLAEARTLGDRGSLRVEPTWGVYGYLANTTRGRLKDPRVRQALAMTIDRDALLARQFAIPAMEPVLGPVAPGLADEISANPDWAGLGLPERRAVAAALLAEAGYGSAAPLVVRVLLPPGPEHARVLAAAAADWRLLGIVTTSETLPGPALAAAIAAGDFELAALERVAPVDIAAFFLRPFTCAAARAFYCNEDFDRQLAAAGAMADTGDRDAALRDAAARLAADTPLVALFTPVRWALVAPYVDGWVPNRAGLHPLDRLATSRRSP